MNALRAMLMTVLVGVAVVTSSPSCYAAGGGGEHHPHPGESNATSSLEDPSEVRPELSLATFVLFLILLAILGKFAWPPIAAALTEREQKIANNIAEAEAKHEEAKALLASHQAKVDAAADEVREMLEEARRDAEHTKEQIVTEAKEAAAAEHQRGIAELRRATEAAMQSMAKQSAEMAVSLAGKVVREDLSGDQQNRVMEEALNKFKNASLN